MIFSRCGLRRLEVSARSAGAERAAPAAQPDGSAAGPAAGDAPHPAGGERSRTLNVPAGKGFLDGLVDPPEMPAWLSQADIAVYAAAFRKNGLRGPFNWYRNLDRNWALLAPFQGAKVLPPALFIASDRDAVIASPMGKRALETLAASAPKLRGKVLIPGAGHWIQQERPAEVNAARLQFLVADYPAGQ